MAPQEKRLFVGGLFDGVDKDDLQERFGKFGSVTDVDIRKRLDDEGNPMKVFAYVNIKMTDENYKKCLQLYNKTRWRGRQVQIQVAKESFIDRLKREREAAGQTSDDKSVASTASKETHEDIKKLQAKGAAPGTAIEGKQDWVVGKYGRPMPVVKIRRKDKQKVVKIDPSNYCHAIKKLEGDKQDVSRSVADLSWFSEEDSKLGKSVNGGRSSGDDSSSSESSDNDDISNTRSKKRKKKLKNTVNSEKKKSLQSLSQKNFPKRQKKEESDSSDSSSEESEHISTSGRSSDVKDLKTTSKKQAVENDFEVVSVNTRLNGNHHGSESDSSVDTDELFSSKKSDRIVSQPKKQPENLPAKQSFKRSNVVELKTMPRKTTPSVSSESESSDDQSSDDVAEKLSRGKKDFKMTPGKTTTSLSSSGSESDDEQSSGDFAKKSPRGKKEAVTSGKPNKPDLPGSELKRQEEADPYDSSDSETPADILRRLANKDGRDSEAKVKSPKEKSETRELGAKKVDSWLGTQDNGLANKAKQELNIKAQSSANELKKCSESPKKIKATASPTKMKAAEKEVKKNQNSAVGKILGSLAGKATKDEFYSGHDVLDGESDESADEEEDLLDLVASGQISKLKKLAKDIEGSVGRPKSSSTKAGMIPSKTEKVIKNEELEKNQEPTESGPRVKEKKKKGEKEKKMFMSKEEKHALANEKRIESMKQREKEHLSHQKAIKVALKSVDQPETNKKIVFESDSEDDVGQSSSMMDTVGMESEQTQMNESPESSESESEEASSDEDKPESKSKSQKSGLFESDDESGDADEDMFRIRPEKEGATGRKLMALQNRLGGDSRFKIDESFLEKEEDEETEEAMKTNDADEPMDTNEERVMEEEKQKSMAILAGIVGSKVTHLAKREKRQVFRDLKAIQYDPTREGHEKLEVTVEAAKPKKKKEKKEAETTQKKKEPELDLPEVSKEKYFTVTSSLKDVFAKDTGFAFNFAVDNQENSTLQAANAAATTEKIEKKNEVMFPWLQKQFSYDSSDEEETSEKKGEEEKHKSVSTEKEKNLSKKSGWGWAKNTFFFTESDPRIKESLDFFCQEKDKEKVREEWEEQRPVLIEAYRMKRKRALRKSNEARKARPWLNNRGPRRKNFHPAKRARKI